ncbi:hypothetical protein F8M41_013341 [Gigaspora margarita]|uniref:BHLH domain-containing protein n=1 Tax=Gigaspora margarita TaxID=4874 RepID=A0A8H3WYH4_GIGMA|nr:hypothetical protein F8M41_013341 [Gigaspora margarita]
MNENSPVNDSEHTRKKHAESEKKRRDEMNIRLDMLRKILASTPYPSNNVSKAELLQNVTLYIKELNNSMNQSRVNWNVEREVLLNEINHLNEEVNRLNGEINYLNQLLLTIQSLVN